MGKKIMIIFFSLFPILLLARINITGEMCGYLSAGWHDAKYYRRNLNLDINLDSMVKNTVFHGMIRLEKDTSKENSDLINLREGYVSQDFYFDTLLNSVNFKIGKLIYTWGNSDELKPVDILNPQDYTYLSFKDLRNRKIGLWSMDLNFYLTENIFFEFVYIPIFQKSEFNSTTFLFEQSFTSAIVPNNDITNSSYASRVGITIFNIDTHIIYFSGFDSLPIPKVSLLGTNQITRFGYQRIEMIGFDFQRALFSGLSIRGEVAYFDYGKQFSLKTNEGFASPFVQNLLAGGNGLIAKKMIDYTIGFDVNDFFVKNFYINCQLNQNYILDWDKEIQQKEITSLLTLNMEYPLFNQKIKLRTSEFYILREEDYGFNFESSMKISGNYLIDIGVWFFDGTSNSYYGLIKDNDFLYLSGKLIF